MDILHVITSLRTGGAEHLMVDLLPRLQERGHRVSLLLFDGTRTPFYEQLQEAGIPIYSLAEGASTMHNPLLIFRLRNFLKEHTFQIIHTHNTPCQLLVAPLANERTTCYVTTEHSTTNRRRRWNWYRRLDRWMYGKYDHVVCVSNDVRNNLIESLGSQNFEDRVGVIANGIDTEKYIKATPCLSLQKQYGGRHLITMVAAFRPEKDQQTLIKAVALLPASYCLLLVGDGECRSACEALAQQLGVASRVHFAGIRSDVPEILAASEVVVMSSCYEGLSLSSIEGMASGRPFIASDADGLRDIVRDAGLLFPLHDAKALTEQIRRCCVDKSWAAEVGARGRERASRYDIQQMVDGYEQIYKNFKSRK